MQATIYAYKLRHIIIRRVSLYLPLFGCQCLLATTGIHNCIIEHFTAGRVELILCEMLLVIILMILKVEWHGV